MLRPGDLLSYCWHRIAHARPATFEFQGRTYPYLTHTYCSAWNCERAVEVPIVWRAVQEHAGARILEVGNVLSHYYPVRHTVVDKYEEAPGVINEDVIDFADGAPYDLIVSISTLEHVGYDESREHPNKDDSKFLRAVMHLRSLLARGGSMLITLPVGYRPAVDCALRDGALPIARMGCLKRISKGNKYLEAPWDAVKDMEFDRPYPCANALVIAEING